MRALKILGGGILGFGLGATILTLGLFASNGDENVGLALVFFGAPVALIGAPITGGYLAARGTRPLAVALSPNAISAIAARGGSLYVWMKTGDERVVASSLKVAVARPADVSFNRPQLRKGIVLYIDPTVALWLDGRTAAVEWNEFRSNLMVTLRDGRA